MGLIFKDINDDQQESMMKTMHIGNTWEYRYFKLKAYFWGTVATLSGVTITEQQIIVLLSGLIIQELQGGYLRDLLWQVQQKQ